ncbi:hypothetical protein AB4179_24110 [Vibrio lentus]|nr:hypothetical protein [Vibrio lentus]
MDGSVSKLNTQQSRYLLGNRVDTATGYLTQAQARKTSTIT